jgi:hypothetical protein
MPGARDEAAVAELLQMPFDEELDDLAVRGDRGRQRVGDVDRGHRRPPPRFLP